MILIFSKALSNESDLNPSNAYYPGDVVALAFYITMLVFVGIFCIWGAVLKLHNRRSRPTNLDWHSETGMVTKSVLNRFPIRLYEFQSVNVTTLGSNASNETLSVDKEEDQINQESSQNSNF